MKNLSYSTQFIDEDDIQSALEVLKGPFLAQGPKVKEFEDNLCKYTGAKYAIAFNSATSALQASYITAGITKGDEVITTPISFVATSNMLIEVGATPIWCDVKNDGNINEEKIKKLITPKTKAIVPVHFAGKPVNLKTIHAIAKKYNLLVIEDAAHALGSSIDGKKIGSFSAMTIFSFHAIKPITTGEGGAVVTDNKEYAKHLALIRSHGIEKQGLWHSDMTKLGYNFRMPELAGALGVSQLKKLDTFIQTRNTIATYYNERFKNEKLFGIQALEENHISSRHLYPLLLNKSLHHKKEEIFKSFQEHKLGVQVHYKPIYKNSYYTEKFGKNTLAFADNFYDSEISIPCHQKMTMDDAKYVADTIIQILNKYTSS